MAAGNVRWISSIGGFFFNNKMCREEEGARVASEVAAQLEREEAEHRRRVEERDTAIARRLQDKEGRKKQQDRRDLEVHTPRKENFRQSHQDSLPASRVLYVSFLDKVVISCPT